MTPEFKGFPSPTAWLWWTALAFLLGGIVLFHLIGLFATETHPENASVAKLVLAVSISLAGICVICATAGWWMRR